jgi:hypothetical protein
VIDIQPIAVVQEPELSAPNGIIDVDILGIMTGIWCMTAYYLVRLPIIASRITKTGHILFLVSSLDLGFIHHFMLRNY